MADIEDRGELERRLWREIAHTRIGMLGLVGGPPQHMKPMTAFCEEEGGRIWFFTRDDNPTVRDARAGHAAMFCLMNKDNSFIACVGGTLLEDQDRGRIDRFWNPVAAAWFPEGKEDPHLTLLRLDAEDADVWVSHTNPVRFAFDIAKANITKTQPDAGEKAHLQL